MANDISTNPWSLDTAGASTIWPVGSRINIHHFEFASYAATTDTATLHDGNGKAVWNAHAASDLRPIVSGSIGWIDGLTLAQISSGVVRVYLK